MARRRSAPPAPSGNPAAAERTGPTFRIEERQFTLGARRVAGIDEAGRGPLAGPVVAAAVVLDPKRIPVGLDDSKRLTARERERLFAEILGCAQVSVATVGPMEIDRINIRQATLAAMTRAAGGLPDEPDWCLIDGIDVPPRLADCATAVVGGDALSVSIAAASIVAKVVRDRSMTALCASFPDYGFSRHMGYGTRQHLAALALHGPCGHHRRSFAPIRKSLRSD